jgi:hypothetical protein
LKRAVVYTLKCHIFLVCKSHGDLHAVFLSSALQYNEKSGREILVWPASYEIDATIASSP